MWKLPGKRRKNGCVTDQLTEQPTDKPTNQWTDMDWPVVEYKLACKRLQTCGFFISPIFLDQMVGLFHGIFAGPNVRQFVQFFNIASNARFWHFYRLGLQLLLGRTRSLFTVMLISLFTRLEINELGTGLFVHSLTLLNHSLALHCSLRSRALLR